MGDRWRRIELKEGEEAMDFTVRNWNSLDRELVRTGVERVGFRGENVICVMNWLSPGMATNPHQHDFEQVALILQGTVNYHVGDEIVYATPGTMITVPAGVVHYAELVGDEVALNLDIFAPVRPDYLHLTAHQDDG